MTFCRDLSGSTNNSYHPSPGTLEKSSPSVPISAGQSLTRLVPVQPILSRRVFGISIEKSLLVFQSLG
jgi:hypothetical protein